MNKEPFTQEEKEVMDLLTQAHNKFTSLPITHPNETLEWVVSFHRLQMLLSMRVLQRDYPQTFFKK